MAVRQRLLFISDNQHSRVELAEQFGRSNAFKTTVIDAAAEGISLPARANFDLILLDVDMKNMHPTEACRHMRRRGVVTPILMLIDEDNDPRKALGLNASVLDYIMKPVQFEVLLDKLRAHLDSHKQSEDIVLQIGSYKFSPALRTLTLPADDAGRQQQEVHLTRKETRILKYLYSAGGQTVTRSELLRELWGYNDGIITHTLETHIYRLRRKIEPLKGTAKLVLTEPGGYRLNQSD